MQISLLHSKHRLATLFVVLIVTLPFSYNCFEKPADFQAPTWETELSIPLLEKTFFFGDLIAKDKAFVSDSATGMYMYVPTNSDPGFVQKIDSSVFAMPAPKGSTISQEIGVVPVTIGNPPSFTLTAAQLGISSANFNPSFNQPPVSMNASKLGITTGNIPALTPDPPPVSINQIFGDSAQYKYLTFENGQMRLKITNNFPFAIQFGSNQIELRNFSNDSLVATFVFSGQIPSNSADSSQSVPLTNVRMGAVLRIKTSMQVVGWAGKTITQTQDVVFLSSITNATIKSIFPDPAPPVPISQVFGDSAKYKHVVFETGQMSLSITNNFPFTIQFDNDSLELVNFSDTTQVVAKFGFSGPINTGLTSTSGTIQLADKKMDAILKMKGLVKISNYFGKTITGSDNIGTLLTLSNTGIKSALAITDDFDGTSVYAVRDTFVVLDDSIKVRTADFIKGKMKVRLINKVPLKITVQFKIDELLDKTTNNTYQLPGTVDSAVTINPSDSLIATLDMSKLAFSSRDASNKPTGVIPVRTLHYTLLIKTLKASSGYVQVNKTDFVTVDVQPTESFELQKVVGSIPPQQFVIDQQYNAGIGDIGDKLTVTKITSAIRLGTSVFTSGGFPADVDLFITPVNKTGVTGTPYHIVERVDPRVEKLVIIDSLAINSMINSFLATTGEFPSFFNLKGKIIVNPDYDLASVSPTLGVGDVDRKDSVAVGLSYAIPVAIGIKQASLKDTTSFSQTFDDTAMVNLIKSGRIYLDVKNTFPLDVEMSLALLKGQLGDKSKVDNTSLPVLTIPQIPSDSVNYPPLRIKASATGDTSGERSFTFLNLTPDDAKKLNLASFTAVNLKMETAGGGNTAKEFKKTDKLVLNVKANIIFFVDQEKFK